MSVRLSRTLILDVGPMERRLELERGESDADLAAAIMDGHREAEAEFCRRFLRRAFAYMLKHTRDRDVALDLAQNTLVIAIEYLRGEKVQHRERVASFVLGTSRNVLRDWQRTRRRRHAILEQTGPVLQELARQKFEPMVVPDRLQRCMSALGERQRTIVLLTYYAERDSSEIAEELGMQSGAVRVARHRALKSLRTCLEASE